MKNSLLNRFVPKESKFIEIILLTFITFAHIVSNIVQFENGNTRQFYTTC